MIFKNFIMTKRNSITTRREFITKTGMVAAGVSVGVAGLSEVYSDIMSQKQNITSAPGGWTTTFPRDEIKPHFSYNPKGGLNRQGSFIIESDKREGLLGRWTKSFPVKGGKHYHFAVQRK